MPSSSSLSGRRPKNCISCTSSSQRADRLGVSSKAGPCAADPRAAWRLFAAHYHLFRGTPSRLWLDHVFAEVFGIDVRLEAATADRYYDRITEALATPAFRPRALFDRFGIEWLATTEGPQDDLDHHAAIRASGRTALRRRKSASSVV